MLYLFSWGCGPVEETNKVAESGQGLVLSLVVGSQEQVVIRHCKKGARVSLLRRNDVRGQYHRVGTKGKATKKSGLQRKQKSFNPSSEKYKTHSSKEQGAFPVSALYQPACVTRKAIL